MKKISILLLAILALFAITACDNSTEAPETVNVPSWADGTYNVKLNGTIPAGTLDIDNGNFTVDVNIGGTSLMQVSSSNITNITEQRDYLNTENQKEYKLTGTLTLPESTPSTASFIFTQISTTELNLVADLGGEQPMIITCEKQ